MAKTSTTHWQEDMLLKKGYIKNPDGSFSPPPIKSKYIQSLKEKQPKVYTKEIVNKNNDFVVSNKYPITLELTPIGKPRMTQRDKWLNPPRKPIKLYWKFKEYLTKEARLKGFEIKENGLHITFVLPMPHSWSQIKKTQMESTPHKSKPDADNMLKALQDCLCESDSHIWDIRITKIWGTYGKIIINEI